MSSEGAAARAASDEAPGAGRGTAILIAICTGPSLGVGHVLLGRFRRGLLAAIFSVALVLSYPLTGIYGLGVLVLAQVVAIVDLLAVRRGETGTTMGVLVRALAQGGGGMALVLLYRTFGFELFHSPSGGMLPTIEVGDHFVVNKLPLRPVRRGDLVVFPHPSHPENDLVKRAVAIAGDTLRFRDGRLWLRMGGDADFAPVARVERGEQRFCDREPGGESWQLIRGQVYEEQFGDVVYKTLGKTELTLARGLHSALAESRARTSAKIEATEDTFGPVPEGFLFVLGDNRENSLDSRFFGIVPEASVKGRAVRILVSYGGRAEKNCEPGVRWSRTHASLE
jgi:signal peptidase I